MIRKCKTTRCRGRATRSGHSPYCSRCRSARWKAKYPLHYAYKQLRNDARRRGHAFDLTLEEYKDFARKSGYALYKGRGAYFLSIDRRDPSKGYSADNIRAMTVRANSARVHYVGRLPQWLKDEIAAAERGMPVPAEYGTLQEMTR